MSGFIHLNIHTEYSLVDSVIRIKPLIAAAAAQGMPALAITDQVNLFALVKFYKACLAAGIKPIVGADLLLEEAEGQAPSRFLLYCMNKAGYLNLTRLISRSYAENQQRGLALIKREWLEGAAEGLIAVVSGHEGDVGRALLAGNDSVADALAERWQRIFPQRFYLEISRTGRAGEADYTAAVAPFAAERQIPLVASNVVRFLSSDDFEAHEARVCIHDGRALSDPRREKKYTTQQYLRSSEEMQALFHDLPEALANTVAIAQRCNLEIKLGTNYLPEFPVPEGETADSHLRELAAKGLKQRLAFLEITDVDAVATYEARLERELNVISDMGFPGYFLIVADFIRWAKENAVPVGPGRGSGAGSLVAYAVEITDLDPLEYDLLFERFLNPERVSMPDFDIDFCMDGRDRVIEYVAEHYGRDKVSQIITFGTMAARGVIRDVGRVLGQPYGFCDRLSKMVPFEVGMTLKKALNESAELAQFVESDDDAGGIMRLAKKLEGIARNTGKHAGGVVIAPSTLTDFSALYCEAGSLQQVTQFDMKDVESVGLVKFDFLGLRTLTIIDWALKEVDRLRAAEGKGPLDIARIPLDDEKTFELLKRQQTTAVFQLESRGMKELIKRLQPDNFDDIIALVALYRPGPIEAGMVDDYVEVKHGRAAAEYPHPSLEEILKPTNGVILYQEQVMQIAQELSGFTLGGADMLRRAMGKKIPEEMAKQRGGFVSGAEANNVDGALAGSIFDLIEKFAGYGFNKSHSAAYALLAYQTAWLKAHYPAAFMAAVLSADMDNTDKVVGLIEECAELGLEVLPPDINTSVYAFKAMDIRRVRYGMGAIKGVGRGAIEAIEAEREAGDSFNNLHELCRRADLRKVNRKVLETAIRAGAADSLGQHRAALMASLPAALKAAEQQGQAEAAGQNDMFGLLLDAPTPEVAECVEATPDVDEWSDEERLRNEKETLGLYLTGHPLDGYREELREIAPKNFAKLISTVDPSSSKQWGRGGTTVRIGGWVTALRVKPGRSAFLTLDDRTARIEVSLFGDALQEYQRYIGTDRILIAEGRLAYDDFNNGYVCRAQRLHDLDDARRQFGRFLELHWTAELSAPTEGGLSFAERLKQLLKPYAGGHCPVVLHYRNHQARAKLKLGEDWYVDPQGQLLQQLTAELGKDAVKLRY